MHYDAAWYQLVLHKASFIPVLVYVCLELALLLAAEPAPVAPAVAVHELAVVGVNPLLFAELLLLQPAVLFSPCKLFLTVYCETVWLSCHVCYASTAHGHLC